MEGQVAIVTGASSGIGQGIAIHLASCGAKVVITGRNVENLGVTKGKCVAAGAKPDNILPVAADLTKQEDMEKIVTTTVDKFGKIDHLVNNAGRGCFDTIETITWEEFNALWETNGRAVFWLTRLALPHLKKTKGSVVVISSIAQTRPNKYSAYSMGKAAVSHLTRCLALEFGNDKVRFNCINPGVVPTNIQELATGEAKKRIDEMMKQTTAVTPLMRTGTPSDIAHFAEFLLRNDQSGWMTGQVVDLDGGYGAVGAGSLADILVKMKASGDK